MNGVFAVAHPIIDNVNATIDSLGNAWDEQFEELRDELSQLPPENVSELMQLASEPHAARLLFGTVLADDPSFTVRDSSLDTSGKQPLRVVLDNDLRMPLSSEMLVLPGSTLIYCIADDNRQPLIDAGAEIVRVDADDGQVDVRAVLQDLARREVNDLLVEAGPALAGSLIGNGLIDELVIYQSPHIMGSETMGMFKTPTWTELADRKTLNITDVRRVGTDTRITAQVAG